MRLRLSILAFMERIGILGGTFDPIHLGHIIPAQYVFNHLHLDLLLLVPTAAPVHRPMHIPAAPEHRLRMCRLAAASLPNFSVSGIETDRADPSYTVLTLRHFADTLPTGTRFFLIVGEDNLPTLHTWRNIDEILRLATIAVIPRLTSVAMDPLHLTEAIGRAAVDNILQNRVPSPLVNISSTEIRRLVLEGKSIEGLVPGSVAQYIAAFGLYTSR